MKNLLFKSLLAFIGHLTVNAQAVYVDCNSGNDKNPGTREAPFFSIPKAVEIIKSIGNDIYVIKINPGIYILDKHVTVATNKEMTDKRIVIEASILPDDTSWTPEKMPVIVSKAKKGELPESFHFVAGLLINESHVTIRGIKFHGYFYPNTRYFPVARFNKTKTDLLVEECMFVGDEHASPIQVGVIAHGNKINIDHCVFYNVRNSSVYWEDSGDGIKMGNSFTNNIVFGAYVSGIWTAGKDSDFIFKNNIISNCKFGWIKNTYNNSKYNIENCIITNNQNYEGNENQVAVNLDLVEHNVIKEGNISLRRITSIDAQLPIDYLQIIPKTFGYELGAGIFKRILTP